MKIAIYSFSELSGTQKSWKLMPFRVGNLNLIVGRNSAGKTRLINTLTVLGQLLTHPPERLWRSGHWHVNFTNEVDTYELQIEIDEHEVRRELFKRNDDILLERGPTGAGKIYSAELDRSISFKVGLSKFAVNTKLDEIQHPFLVSLAKWAQDLRRYSFGSEFGKTSFYAASPAEFDSASDASGATIDPNLVGRIYMDGFARFGDEFDQRILADFREIGYPCEIITCSPFDQDPGHIPGRIAMVISVKEVGLEAATPQHEMSMGMYRSLALLINLHHKLMNNLGGTILIDDIGEGLDFERATSLIQLIVNRSEHANVQLIMSTNDRFVMNAVDLKYWQILHRKGSVVQVENKETAPEVFRNFTFLGLSNFDFFASETAGAMTE